MAKNFLFQDYFYNLDENGIQLDPECNKYNTKELCNNDLNCKYNDDTSACENNTIMDNLEFNQMTTEQLQNILLTRNRMLEVNLHKNDIKNKKIYTMFVFLIIIILVMTIIHFKSSK